MRRILTILLILMLPVLGLSQVIWQETFNGLSNGTTVDNGATAWSIDLTTNCGGSVSGSFAVQGNRFRSNDTDCDAWWVSQWIDISSYSSVIITADVSGTGSLDGSGGNADTLKIGYRLDGGTAITWSDLYAGTTVNGTNSCQGGSGAGGDSIQIVISSLLTGSGEFHNIDDITLQVGGSSGVYPTGGGDTLFARQDGDWDQNGTWSNTFGGSSCGCTPDSNSVVYITCGFQVLIDNDEWAREIYVESGGQLDWDSGDDELNISSNGIIEISAGGRIWESGENNAEIHFEGAGTHYLRVYDTDVGLEIDEININNPCTLIIEGNGRIDIEDDFEHNSDDVVVYNRFTEEIYVADNFDIDGDDIVWFNDSGYLYIDGQFNVDNRRLNFTNRDTVFIDEDLDCNQGDDGVITNYGYMWVDGDDFELSNNTERFVVNNYGWFRLDDDLKEVPTGANACEWYNFAGSYFELGHNDAELDWEIYANYDSNTVDYFKTANQDFIFTPEDAYWNLTLSGSGRKRTRADLDINGTVRIEGSAQFDPNNGNDDLEVAGSWFNTSSSGNGFIEGTETVTFDGSGRQVVNRTAAAGETFYDVVIDKDDSLKLQSDMQIASAGSIAFTDGHVSSDSVDRLIVLDNATVTGASNASFVDGRIQKTGNDAFVYPVGDNGDYQPLSQSAPSSTAHAFEAQYYQADPRTNWNHESLDGVLHHVSTEEYWIFNRTAGGGTVTVTLTWDANSGGVDNLDSLAVARWDGSQWTSEGNGGTTGNTSAGTVVSAAAITNYSPFTLGSVINDFTINPLPLSLISFVTYETPEGIRLEWRTSNERNIDRYFIMKQESNGEWNRVMNEDPRFQTPFNDYSRLDLVKLDGWNNYKLFEVTDDGAEVLLAESAVLIKIAEEEQLMTFPNPAHDQLTVILPVMDNISQPTYSVVNLAGRVQASGSFNQKVNSLSLQKLKPGVYTLMVEAAYGVFHSKFIKQ